MLALIILNHVWENNNSTDRSRIEVRSTARKLVKVCSISMDFGDGTFAHKTLASLNVHGWLATDGGNRH